MSCRLPEENTFVDQTELENKTMEDAITENCEIYEYSPNIISHYYGEPTSLPSNCVLAPEGSAEEFQDVNSTGSVYCNANLGMGVPYGNYIYEDRIYLYPEMGGYQTYNNGYCPYPNREDSSYSNPHISQVSTYINPPGTNGGVFCNREGYYNHGMHNEQTHGGSKVRNKLSNAYENSSNSQSPLETFDSLINMRLKSFKNYNVEYTASQDSNGLEQSNGRSNSLHLIEQWKREREILQKLFPESSPSQQGKDSADKIKNFENNKFSPSTKKLERKF